MYVEFMKNFLLADSCEQMPVTLVTASWAQKHLFLLSRHDYFEFMKNFLVADSGENAC